MKFYKVKLLKNGQPSSRSYTYKSEDDLKPGDNVKTASGQHGVIVDEPVDSAFVLAYGAEKVAVVCKYEEREDK